MINLIPPNQLPRKGLFKRANIIRSITLVSLIVFIVFAVGMGGVLLIGSSELRSLTTRNSALKNGIKDREGTEQKMVLLKDRIAKIKKARSASSSKEKLEGISGLASSVAGSSIISELSFDSAKVDLTVVFRNSSELSTFLKGLAAKGTFDTVVLTSFGFNPSSGYILSLRLTENVKK